MAKAEMTLTFDKDQMQELIDEIRKLRKVRTCITCEHHYDTLCARLTFEPNDYCPTEATIHALKGESPWGTDVTIGDPNTFGCNLWEARGDD